MSTPPRSKGEEEVRAARSYVAREVVLPLQEYIHTVGVGGAVLLASAAVALLWANSPWSRSYFHLREQHLTLDLALFTIDETLQHWINDGLMTIFFFVVGLEVKREFARGELSDRRRATLPVAAAVGGMALPALIYLGVNLLGGGAASGWGIPMATDVAFALGVLALVGERVPHRLRVLLLAMTVIDDIGAILVIALFYTRQIAWVPLALAAAALGAIFAMRRLGLRNLAFYAIAGLLLWAAVQQSGVHATLAGVLLGVLTPARPLFAVDRYRDSLGELTASFDEAREAGEEGRARAILGQIEELTRGTEAPLDRLERTIHPWSSFLVLPIFALANAGVDLGGRTIPDALASPVAWGVFAGLVVGKPLGILGVAWGASRLLGAERPQGVTWSHLAGMAILAGIGFTVSLFIAELAFGRGGGAQGEAAKVGILAASLVAGLGGYLFLRFVPHDSGS